MARLDHERSTTSTPASVEPTAASPTSDAAFLPRRDRRFAVESAVMRVVATCGVVGICVALAAILGSQDVAAWIIGLVASGLSVLLAAVLWSSRTL